MVELKDLIILLLILINELFFSTQFLESEHSYLNEEKKIIQFLEKFLIDAVKKIIDVCLNPNRYCTALGLLGPSQL